VDPRPTVGSDVVVTPIETRADFDDAMAVFERVWQLPPEGRPLSWELFVGMTHAGTPAFVARSAPAGTPLGASLAVCGVRQDGTAVVHSHMTGVLPGLEHRGVGRALKQTQWTWARERGIARVEWTFDPLVRRNGWFNLRVLGASADEYLEDAYGELRDAINAGVESDRLLAVWRVGPAPPTRTATQPDLPVLLSVGAGTEPVAHELPPGARGATVEVPADIVALRRGDPALARRWRLAVRASLGRRMGQGWTVTGMTDDQRYVVEQPSGPEDAP
jgi:predicted GNAT superfamily acetyltransferase